VPGDEHRPVVREQRGLGADDVEEARDVRQRLLVRDRIGLGQPLEPARAPEERVQDLAGGPFVGQLDV